MVLHCNGRLDEMEAVSGAVGEMTTMAAKRADIAFDARRTPIDIDIAASEAEFKSLIEGRADA